MIHGDPELATLMEAARVADFYEESQFGRWRAKHFEITQQDYNIASIKVMTETDSKERRALGLTRVVPPGNYVSLQRRMTPEERVECLRDEGFYDPDAPEAKVFLPPEREWMPVMSDTPAEIVECAPALDDAGGRVLITGLGLGCVVHALLTKPSVEHIDVVEIDPDVIALSGRYINDPRVTVRRGSATRPWDIFPHGTRWDYAWHDIWTAISDHNLIPEEAEHGIAYRTLFALYENWTEHQGAWAYDQAMEMARIHVQEAEEELKFQRKVKALDPEGQVEVLYDRILRSRMPGLPEGTEIPASWIEKLDPEGKLKEHVRGRVSDPDFWEKFEAQEGRREWTPSHPNRHLEEAGR